MELLMNTSALLEQLESQRRRVDFDTYDITVQQLIAMVESGAIDVAPVYQRQFRWDDSKRAHLVESVFLGVPVPSLFMAANRDGTWELVDGVQRLSTLVQFAGTEGARKRLGLKNPLVIAELEKLSELSGSRFSELPDSLKLQFNLRPIKVVTLSDKSDLVVRFDLFERLNTGGVALTDQEIRGCIFRGQFNEFLERLAKSSEFRAVVRLTDRQEGDGTREECVLRFFAFLFRYRSFVHSVVDFLNDFMRQATGEFDYEGGEQRFRDTFRQLSKALPSGIVRGEGRKITPINLYEAVSVGAALALKKKSKLATRGIGTWLNSVELRKLTTGATNNRSSVVGRIEYCRDRFLGS
jgi:uncharacterized protein with ParB-like and HNH nuclease domain